jgi:hypothetical protein
MTTNIEKQKQKENAINQTTTYKFDGYSFVVEAVFKENSSETLGTVLLRLMTTKS